MQRSTTPVLLLPCDGKTRAENLEENGELEQLTQGAARPRKRLETKEKALGSSGVASDPAYTAGVHGGDGGVLPGSRTEATCSGT